MRRETVTIGRDPHNDICVEPRWDTVSNRHGELIYENGQLTFSDHSSNGTVINGQKIHNTSVGIYPGDSIRLANEYDLDWHTLERFFPDLQRPTVTRNVRSEQTGGRRTIQLNVNEIRNERKTERFEGPVGYGPTRPAGNQERPQGYSSGHGTDYGKANSYSQSEIDRELEKWNWGAFFCSWLWAVFNGIYWPALVLLVVAVPYVGQVCALCLSVYLGINGSKMAWRNRSQRDFENFRTTQRNWAIGGVIWFALCVLGSIYSLNYALMYL